MTDTPPRRFSDDEREKIREYTIDCEHLTGPGEQKPWVWLRCRGCRAAWSGPPDREPSFPHGSDCNVPALLAYLDAAGVLAARLEAAEARMAALVDAGERLWDGFQDAAFWLRGRALEGAAGRAGRVGSMAGTRASAGREGHER